MTGNSWIWSQESWRILVFFWCILGEPPVNLKWHCRSPIPNWKKDSLSLLDQIQGRSSKCRLVCSHQGTLCERDCISIHWKRRRTLHQESGIALSSVSTNGCEDIVKPRVPMQLKWSGKMFKYCTMSNEQWRVRRKPVLSGWSSGESAKTPRDSCHPWEFLSSHHSPNPTSVHTHTHTHTHSLSLSLSLVEWLEFDSP